MIYMLLFGNNVRKHISVSIHSIRLLVISVFPVILKEIPSVAIKHLIYFIESLPLELS